MIGVAALQVLAEPKLWNRPLPAHPVYSQCPTTSGAERGYINKDSHFGTLPQVAALAAPALIGTSNRTHCSKRILTCSAQSTATSSRQT